MVKIDVVSLSGRDEHVKKSFVVAGLIAGVALLSSGCGTPGTHTYEQSTIGTLVGAGAGTLIGAAWGRPAEGALAGALLGAAAGTAVGSSMDQEAAIQAQSQAQAQTQAYYQAYPPMSKYDLVALSKAGVSSDVIVNKIMSASYVYPLNTQDIIELKNEGVDDKVVNAMIEKARQQANQPPSVSAAAPAATAGSTTTTVYVEPVPVPYFHVWYYNDWRYRPVPPPPGPPPPGPPPPGPRPGPGPGPRPGPRPGPPR